MGIYKLYRSVLDSEEWEALSEIGLLLDKKSNLVFLDELRVNEGLWDNWIFKSFLSFQNYLITCCLHNIIGFLFLFSDEN